MLWMLFLPIFVMAKSEGREITFESLKLRLIDHPRGCPDIKDLKRNSDMYWYADGGWRSYNTSFSKTLVRLVGVQWQGDKVGNIFCQYKDRSKLTFPVALQAPGLYLRPSDAWGYNDQQKSMNCKIPDLAECKFQQVEEVVNTYKSEGELYDFLEKIKKGEDDV